MLLLFALIVGSGSVWATDVTFTAGTEQGTNGSSGNPDTMKKSGITISGTSFATTTTEYRIYSGSTMTISSSVGNITKIVITSTAKKGSTKYGPESLTAASGYTTEDNSYDGTWTGSATSIEFYALAQCRASKIVVTYEAPTKVATPTFDPAAGAVASGTEVTISCGTDGATIYYTTDGTDPTTSSTAYAPASKPTITAATTIKAYAVKDGLTDSEIASASYTIALPCATPTFSEPEGEVDKGTTVTITCATDGATIYYTTDGTTPTTSSSEYSSALTINTNQTIKAIAAKDGNANSAVASATYTVRDYATLPFNWDGGTSTEILTLSGVTGNSLGDYAPANAPYCIQFNSTSDYIQVKTNAQLGQVSASVKMIGGATTSKIKVQESSDGSVFTDVEEFTISGKQNDEHTFKTSIAFNATSRFVRIIKSIHATGGNIGVGPIKITGCEAISTASGKTYATYVTTNGLNFSVVSDDIKAYVAASEAAAGKITFTGKDAVPAGTPILVKTTSKGATVNVPVATSAPAAVGTNKLVAGPGSAINYNDGGKYNYILTNGQFKPANNSFVAVDKAYLSLGAAAANELTISFDDEDGGVTGIAEMKAMRNVENETFYDLQGRRVAQPTKGLYIVNGKKVVLK